MEATVAFGVGNETVALLVKLSRVGEVFGRRLSKVVLIDKVIASVVRRVDVNHLHLVEISLLQALQYVEVVALDVEVLRVVEVHALLTAGTQCGIDR